MSLNCILELSNLASAQSIKKDVQPFEVCADQWLQDLFIKELHDIVDILAKKDSHAEFNGPVLLLLLAQFWSRCICEELQAALVEIFIVFLSAVVSGKCTAEVRVYLGVDVCERLETLLHFVKNFKAVMVLT